MSLNDTIYNIGLQLKKNKTIFLNILEEQKMNLEHADIH